MLDFIVCDDNPVIRENISIIITKLMIQSDMEYQTKCFSSYDKTFNQIISKNGKKIYILDIEVGNVSGLDVARKIREKDWNSIIILLTAHSELAYEAIKNRLMLLDFISKFDDYNKNLYQTLQIALKVLGDKAKLIFKSGTTIHNVDFDEILYILKCEASRNIKIKTYSDEYFTSMSLNKISGLLNNNFIKTHRACIINKENVKKINFKENKIIFKNDEIIDLLSKNYKKEVRKYAFN